jgi:HAD superfamily hydrolase (TIGR01450 family)
MEAVTTTDTATTGLWLLDLDGVVWLGDQAIPGAATAIRRLRESGRRVAFFTNNSFASRSELIAKFAAHDIEADDHDILSSAEAAAGLVNPGERVFVLGGHGILEALAARGIEVVTKMDEKADVVMVGLDRDLHFDRLTAATRAVHAGARLIGTNDDATYPTPDGPLPGGGALLAAVAYATSETPIVAGKPHQAAADLVAARLGKVEVMVGDRPSTDGMFGRRLGARFALVRSGVTAPGVAVDDPTPDLDAADLATLVAQQLGDAP